MYTLLLTSTSVCIISCNPYYFQFFIGEEIGSEKTGCLPKATQLIRNQEILEPKFNEPSRRYPADGAMPLPITGVRDPLGTAAGSKYICRLTLASGGEPQSPTLPFLASFLKDVQEEAGLPAAGNAEEGVPSLVGGLPVLRVRVSLTVPSVLSARTSGEASCPQLHSSSKPLALAACEERFPTEGRCSLFH